MYSSEEVIKLQTQKITKTIAIALFITEHNPPLISPPGYRVRVANKAMVDAYLTSSDILNDGRWSLIAPKGTKIVCIRRGARIDYYLSGYSEDGSDVAQALATVAQYTLIDDKGDINYRLHIGHPNTCVHTRNLKTCGSTGHTCL